MEAFGSLEFFRLPPGLPERRYTNPDDSNSAGEDDAEMPADGIPETYAPLFRRAETLLPDLDEDERNEIVDLMEDIREALRENRAGDAEALRSELDDALFYLEG